VAGLGRDALAGILREHGVRRVWDLNEMRLDPEYALDLDLCRFGEVEHYCASERLDWVVYVSHESSSTFAGGWLVDAVKGAWPNLGWGPRGSGAVGLEAACGRGPVLPIAPQRGEVMVMTVRAGPRPDHQGSLIVECLGRATSFAPPSGRRS
jgi:hypothetical protein